MQKAIKKADEIFKYYRDNNKIEKKEIPSEDVLKTLIEAVIASNRKEEKQALKRATHEQIEKFLKPAIGYTKYLYVEPTVQKVGITSFNEAERTISRNTCKQAIRSLLKSHDLYFDNAALDVYIGSISNELEPKQE